MGSETSQYHLESKSNEITRVVASERVGAQTQFIFELGVVGLRCETR
jgi:hypothetical protein